MICPTPQHVSSKELAGRFSEHFQSKIANIRRELTEISRDLTSTTEVFNACPDHQLHANTCNQRTENIIVLR